MMNPLKLRFLTERYEKELLDLKLQEEYIALPVSKPVSSKFYSPHEALSTEGVPIEFVNIIKRRDTNTPKDYYEFPPPCSNMEYGWYTEPLIPRSTDKRLNFSITQCDFIKKEIYIKEMQNRMPAEKKKQRQKDKS